MWNQLYPEGNPWHYSGIREFRRDSHAPFASFAATVQQPCSNLSKSPEMLGNTPTQKCGDFQQFCKLWKTISAPSHGGGQGFESPRVHSLFRSFQSLSISARYALWASLVSTLRLRLRFQHFSLFVSRRRDLQRVRRERLRIVGHTMLHSYHRIVTGDRRES